MTKSIYFIGLLLFTSNVIGQTQNFWTKKSDFSGLKRERAVSFTIDGKGYIGTGVDTTDVVKADFWAYDPLLDAWTQVANIPGDARRNAVSFSINNLGYVGTGMNNADANLGNPLNDFWAYDAVSNSWTTKASFPGSLSSGVYFATGFSADNKGYICGGKRGPNNYTDEFWEYKPTTDQWTQRQNFPGGVRYQLCSFVVDNLAYIGLGVDQDVYRKDFWQYNPATNGWIQKNDFIGGERGAVSTFSLGQRGFICLGSDGGFKGDLWEYNPFSDAWSPRAGYGGSNRKNAVAFTINNLAYVGTGKGVSGKKMSMYSYSPYAILSTLESVLSTIKVNQNQSEVNIYFENLRQKTVSIYTISGQLIALQESNEKNIHLNTSDYESSLYILVVKDENKTIIHSQKLIIL